MRIRDGKNSDSGWKKFGSGIQDKYPGSATLRITKEKMRKCLIRAPMRKLRNLRVKVPGVYYPVKVLFCHQYSAFAISLNLELLQMSWAEHWWQNRGSHL
jgi:hypothetical protein